MIDTHIDLSQFFSAMQWSVVLDVAAIAQSKGWRAYAVGGVVRDATLKSLPNSEIWQGAIKDSLDVDLVIDGSDRSGIEVAIALHSQYPQAKLQIYPKFQTAELRWSNFSLDIATARSETYEYPGANPKVQASHIQQDLERRDFTINALAVELQPNFNFRNSQIIDLCDGLTDLAAQQIRPIRVGSFAEDPRRIYRAVRFAVRFQFQLTQATVAEIVELTSSGLHDRLGGSRLRSELNYLLDSSQAVKMLRLLESVGGLRCVHPQLSLPVDFSRQFRCLKHWWLWFGSDRTAFNQISLELLLSYLPPALVSDTNLNLSTEQIKRQQKLEGLSTIITELSKSQVSPSQIVEMLQNFGEIALILGAAKANKLQRRLLWQYFTQWRQVKSLLSGDDLIQLGCDRGKIMGQVLQKLRNASLDRKIFTKAEAISLARQLISQTSV